MVEENQPNGFAEKIGTTIGAFVSVGVYLVIYTASKTSFDALTGERLIRRGHERSSPDRQLMRVFDPAKQASNTPSFLASTMPVGSPNSDLESRAL
jgi:hypothetical protein